MGIAEASDHGCLRSVARNSAEWCSYFRYAFGRPEGLTQDRCSLESMSHGLVNTDGSGLNASKGSLLQMYASIAAQQPFLYRKVK
jgi:hypothetical protein